jgi:hypothetical protein
MIILGMSLIVILIAAVLANQYLTDLNAQKASNEARLAVGDLASAANSVWRQGIGAKKRVLVKIPSGVNSSNNVTFIGRPANDSSSPMRTINIRFSYGDVAASTDVDVNGTMPANPGGYSLWVISRDTYVYIGNSSS